MRVCYIYKYIYTFQKEGHVYRRQRKAATQACKTSARAPPPRRRAGKEPMTKQHAHMQANQDGRGARSAELR